MEFFSIISTKIGDVLKQLFEVGDKLTAGLVIIAATAITISFIYKSYLITSGLVPNPLSTTVKDFIVKITILTFAGLIAGSAFNTDLNNVFVDVSDKLIKTFIGSDDIYKILDENLEKIATALIPAESPDRWAINIVGKAKDALNELKLFLKFAIIWIGFLYLAGITFILLTMNKVLFYISIGFSPLFIFFLAFENTKSWFYSWINAVMGYGLSLAVISFTEKVLLKILFLISDNPNNMMIINFADMQQEPSIGECFGYLALCVIFAKIIMQVGSLVSSWFGGQNSSAEMAGTASGMAAGASMRGLSASASVGGAASKAGGKALGKGAKGIYNLMRKIRLKGR